MDGSYLYKKQQLAGGVVDTGSIPEPPLTGWVEVKPGSDIIKEIPIVTHGIEYTKLKYFANVQYVTCIH